MKRTMPETKFSTLSERDRVGLLIRDSPEQRSLETGESLRFDQTKSGSSYLYLADGSSTCSGESASPTRDNTTLSNYKDGGCSIIKVFPACW